jgi:hypothetical protein
MGLGRRADLGESVRSATRSARSRLRFGCGFSKSVGQRQTLPARRVNIWPSRDSAIFHRTDAPGTPRRRRQGGARIYQLIFPELEDDQIMPSFNMGRDRPERWANNAVKYSVKLHAERERMFRQDDRYVGFCPSSQQSRVRAADFPFYLLRHTLTLDTGVNPPATGVPLRVAPESWPSMLATAPLNFRGSDGIPPLLEARVIVFMSCHTKGEAKLTDLSDSFVQLSYHPLSASSQPILFSLTMSFRSSCVESTTIPCTFLPTVSSFFSRRARTTPLGLSSRNDLVTGEMESLDGHGLAWGAILTSPRVKKQPKARQWG